MIGSNETRLFVCYVPGLDLRRITPGTTPFLRSLLDRYPRARLRTLPTTELVPTMFTGVPPHEHGVWQLRLRDAGERRAGAGARFLEVLPDLISTTAQCAVHYFTRSVDLATVPPRRRGRFELRRYKYERRMRDGVEKIGEAESIFSLLGAGRSRYRFCRKFGRLEELLATLPSGDLRLELLEMYALDLTQHWNLDRAEKMRRAYRRVDDFVRALRERCAERGIGFVLLIDHGQERVTGTVDLAEALRASGVPDDTFDRFVEVSSARFWFHTAAAREKIRGALEGLANVRVLTWREMHEYGVRFEDPSFGELYVLTNPGHVFFPHDFYQPLANLWLGLTDPQQRPRVRNPVHRGQHGYLPDNESEVGLVLLADEAYEARADEAELVDVAPTLLSLLDLDAEKPAAMRGTAVFRRRA